MWPTGSKLTASAAGVAHPLLSLVNLDDQGSSARGWEEEGACWTTGLAQSSGLTSEPLDIPLTFGTLELAACPQEFSIWTSACGREPFAHSS